MIIIPTNSSKKGPVAILASGAATMPSHVAGNMIVICAMVGNGVSAPAGWTLFCNGGGGNGLYIGVIYKVATSSSETIPSGWAGQTLVLENGVSAGNRSGIVSVYGGILQIQGFSLADTSGNSLVLAYKQHNYTTLNITTGNIWSSYLLYGQTEVGKLVGSTAIASVPTATLSANAGIYGNSVAFEIKNN